MTEPTGSIERGFSRAQALRAGLAGAGAALVGGVLLDGRPAPAESQGSARRDTELLNFVLLVEHVQAAFYDQALEAGRLKGELREFARVVGEHERAHQRFLEQTLGSDARSRPKLEFGDDVREPEAFSRTARRLEDLGVAAYNAGAPNLSDKALRAAARIVSVEARHAAWIRDIREENPAPDASEPQRSPEQMTSQLNDFGFIK